MDELTFTRAAFNREVVALAQVMYCEAYTEHDESDIFDMLERELLDIEQVGYECDLLANICFSSEVL